MKKRIALKVGHETATQMSNYSALIEVASLALGGGGKDGKSATPAEDLTKLDPASYAARLSSMIGI